MLIAEAIHDLDIARVADVLASMDARAFANHLFNEDGFGGFLRVIILVELHCDDFSFVRNHKKHPLNAVPKSLDELLVASPRLDGRYERDWLW
jgi:hypothetical protein